MSVTRRATYGRLLLFAALLLGIVTMHTLGHPADHAGAASMTPAAHAMAPAARPGTPPAIPPAAAPAPYTVHAMAPAAPVAASAPASYTVHGSAARHPAPEPASPHGMDPLAVCLAVLGVWGLALLVILLVTRRAAGRMPRSAGARPARLPRPPPPRRSGTALLTDLSVLRV
ncbi:hypothetical protein [Streptomyces sp. NPDC001478]